jgi:hypothetical protein
LPFIETRFCPEPSALITNICGPPSRSETNAICDPSGDQAGPESMARLLVSRFRIFPL